MKNSAILFIVAVLFFSSYNQESKEESEIKSGIKLIARYFDSLSFKTGARHEALFYIKPENKNNCDSLTFCIMPLIVKSDLQFRNFNYYMLLENRKFLLDRYFDSIVQDKFQISKNIQESIMKSLIPDEWIHLDSRTVLYYISCEKEKYLITYYSESKQIIDHKLKPLPYRKWSK
jgi:hypothetical protein